MAEKLKNGISRELRYVEYKLRKRKNDRSHEKKKKSMNYPSMTEPSSSLSEEFKDVVPSNHGEEDLQLQVALAMSREEAKEKDQSEVSDKIRFELALKESAELSAKANPKHSSQSLESVGQPSADPWCVPEGPKATSDPFISDPTETVSNSFGYDAWGSSTTSMPQPIQPVDPWNAQASGSSVASFPPQAQNTSASFDPWGSTSNTTQVADPWGGNIASSAAPTLTNDPWGGSTTTNKDFGLNTMQASNTNASDPFQPKIDSAFTPTQSIDPLHEFDNLTLQPSQPSTISTSYTATDIFSSDVLTPRPIVTSLPSKVDENGNNLVDGTSKRAGEFLGANAGLVNIDSLVAKPSSNAYVSLSTSGAIGANRNPFNVKGPTKSLNEMKGQNPTSFGGQIQTMPITVGAYPNTMQPTPLSVSPGIGMMVQPGYAMPTLATTNPFASVQPPQNNSFQQNDSLL